MATLRIDQCAVNQRSGTITIVDSKGCKTRTLDLHNQARRALYAYLYENAHAPDARDVESAYVFTGQRAAWLRRHGRPDHLSTRAIEHLWLGLKRTATHAEWQQIKDITFHDLRHDWAHRARQSGWLLEEIAVYAGHQTKDGARDCDDRPLHPAISSTDQTPLAEFVRLMPAATTRWACRIYDRRADPTPALRAR